MIVTTALMTVASVSHAATSEWYVDNSHPDSGNSPAHGTQQAPFKTISYAADWPLLATGHTIWVKAGNYGFGHEDPSDPQIANHKDADGVSIDVDGVSLRGYSEWPINPFYPEIAAFATYSQFEDDKQYLDQLFPVIHGENRGQGIGMNLTQVADVLVSGFAIQNFNGGILVFQSPNCTVEHMVLETFGEPTTANHYVGIGIKLQESPSSKAKYCIVADAQAEGFRIRGSNMSLIGCTAFSKNKWGPSIPEHNAGMDYAFIVNGTDTISSRNNTIKDCCARFFSFTDSVYAGHSFVLSSIPGADGGQETNLNTIENCVADGGGPQFHLRGPNTHDNDILECKAENAGYRGVYLEAGPHGNRFDRMKVEAASHSVSVVVHKNSDTGVITAGDVHSNRFTGCWFHVPKTETGIPSAAFGTVDQPGMYQFEVRDNLFVNCTFSGDGQMSRSTIRPVFSDLSNTAGKVEFKNNVFVNCIVSRFMDYEDTTSDVFEARYDFCCFYNPDPASSIFSQLFGPDQPGSMDDATFVGPQVVDEDPTFVDFWWHTDKVIDLHIQNSALENQGATKAFLQTIHGIGFDLMDIDGEVGPYDPIYSGGSARYDIGCDEVFP